MTKHYIHSLTTMTLIAGFILSSNTAFGFANSGMPFRSMLEQVRPAKLYMPVLPTIKQVRPAAPKA